MKWTSRGFSSLVACSLLVACGGSGGDGGGVVNPPPPVASVTVTAPASLFEGATSQASVVVADANGASLSGRTVSWSSSNEAAATVSPAGLVTAVATGSATISATSEGKTGSSAVNVTRDPAPASIAVTAPTSSVVSGGTLQLATVVKNTRGQVITPPSITYTSSAPGVAAVSNNGVVTSVGPVGSANITATVGTVTSTPVSVTVSPGAVASVTKQADLPASAPVASSSTISVKAMDSFGNPVPGATVTFAVTGGGSVTPGTATTDGTGAAGASFTFSNTAGTNTVVATVAGAGSPATFTATGTAAAATSAAMLPGTDGQRAPAGGTVPILPAIKITDSFGNPVVGVQVRFAYTTSGGTVIFGDIPTLSNGVATFDRWSLEVGANQLQADVVSLGKQFTFHATGT